MTTTTSAHGRPLTSFSIDRDASEPLYRQLRASIESGIATGSINTETPLPSSRQLADELGLSRNTVNAAYQELLAAGLLDSKPRQGLFVSPALRANQLPRPATAAGTFDWQRRLHFAGQPARAARPADERRKVTYSFVAGQVDITAFPSRVWAKALAEALRPPHDRVSLAASTTDDPLLIEMICRYVLPARGIHATPDQVLITMGSTHARTLITRALGRPGLRVAYESPGPPSLPGGLADHGLTGIPLPVDAHGLIPPLTLDGVDVLVVSPSQHRPTSVTMPGSRRRALLDLARTSGTVIVENDDETDLRYRGSPLPSMMALDRIGQVVHVGTFASVLAPGVTVGFIVGAPAVISVLHGHRQSEIARVTSHVQRALALLISSGDYQTAVRQHRDRMRERWETMRTAVAAHLPGTYTDADGGGSLWITGPSNLDCRRLEVLAGRAGIAIERGDLFFPQAQPPRHHFRLGFGAIPQRLISPGIQQLARLIPYACVATLPTSAAA
jgi:GntR family transcriptional regulator / MocR family aminotransferase